MHTYRFRNFDEYKHHSKKQAVVLKKRRDNLFELENANRDKGFLVKGFSITAEQEVHFSVDWRYSNGTNVNWRERLICPFTQLNNRQRASYHIMLSELQLYADDTVYITEQVTPLFRFLKSKIPQIVGSEYIDSQLKSGDITEAGHRHENLTELSFDTESLDKIFTFDCLEHIPQYKLALEECYRTLVPNGKLFLSFPFNKNCYKTLVRAEILESGEVNHITKPEYHGDPMSGDGCLSYYTFGWDVLETLRGLGFRDVYAVTYWSDTFGYLGDEQITFVAIK